MFLLVIMEENKTVAAEAMPAAQEETKKAAFNASVAPENFDWDAFEKEVMAWI